MSVSPLSLKPCKIASVPARPPYLAAATLAGLAIVCGFAAIGSKTPRAPVPPPRIEISPAQLWADGADSATLTITAAPGARPRVSLQGNPHIATIASPEFHNGQWTAEIHAGVLPGAVQIRVDNVRATLATVLAPRDSREDGTPDFLRLGATPARAFRRWFTFLAEAQYFQRPDSRPSEILDCAALIRYAYRESLRAHDSAWAAATRLPLVPAFDSPGKYEYPFTALGASLFRVAPGPFRAADLSNGAFAQFADAKTLLRFNTHLISRDLARAQPADILFYRQSNDNFHSMIYLGPSQIHPETGQGGAATYVLYHTGPQDDNPGEMRRLTLDQLRRFPDPEWRPDAENPRFLGVYRWNILSTTEPLS
jgi:uncharacterized protein YfaT (DUF1175 family)